MAFSSTGMTYCFTLFSFLSSQPPLLDFLFVIFYGYMCQSLRSMNVWQCLIWRTWTTFLLDLIIRSCVILCFLSILFSILYVVLVIILCFLAYIAALAFLPFKGWQLVGLTWRTFLLVFSLFRFFSIFRCRRLFSFLGILDVRLFSILRCWLLRRSLFLLLLFRNQWGHSKLLIDPDMLLFAEFCVSCHDRSLGRSLCGVISSITVAFEPPLCLRKCYDG